MTSLFRALPLLSLVVCSHAVAEATSLTRIETTNQDAVAAKAWRLTESDWNRYKEIQAGPRGIWSPGLDPVTSLGISAETDAERRRYAELLVQLEKKRVEQELAFQREYDAAWTRLYPDLLPIMPSGNQSSSATGVVQGAARLLVFVSPSCVSCNNAVANLVKKGTPFDLFVVGSRNDDLVIREWAKSAGIPPDQVRSRQITLNHDSGQWLDLGGLAGTLPAAFKRAGNQWLPVEL